MAGKQVIAMAAGVDFSLALCSDGTLAAWGNNINGQLSNNSTTESHLPVAVSMAGTPLASKQILIALDRWIQLELRAVF